MNNKPDFIKTLESKNYWDINQWYNFLQYKEFFTKKEMRNYTDYILEVLYQHFDKSNGYQFENSYQLFRYFTLETILNSLP